MPHRRSMFDDLPRCARCGRDVDDLIVSRDARSGEYTLTACCHGARETVLVSDLDMMGMLPESVRFGVAFREACRASPTPANDVPAKRMRRQA